ncbi:hypothetical protein SELMODRAFT_419769 [Selaginella moellendorffii]|uniref:Uncharacterized protein n=1 Tax=Selaginella moellendorffii TaxID=88036 RepID=D8S9Z3_SELML|nr:hypothetical protein SELMODRAFT_419769 [Selaginella moellendorffii]
MEVNTNNGDKDLWRLDLNTNIWREQLQLKGCPGARSGHRLWQEIKPKLGAAWPSAGTGSQLAVYLDEVKKSGDSLHSVFMIEMYMLSRWFVSRRFFKNYLSTIARRYERSRQKKSDTTTFPRWTFDVWKCIIEETQSAWIEASKEKGETDGDNSDAGSINKGKDEEDDDEVVKKKDWSHCEEAAAILRGEGKKLTQKARKLNINPSWAWLIPNKHFWSSGRMDLTWQRHATENLNPSLTSSRLEADHNAEEEATKPSKERSTKKR